MISVAAKVYDYELFSVRRECRRGRSRVVARKLLVLVEAVFLLFRCY